ncbi:MAG: ATP-dependent DNA helicase, partial [Actinomycetes bacterium]
MTTDDVSAALIAAAEQVGGRPRAGQLVMAEAITAAINTHEHLIVQAGTGTGKSLAYLVPAFLHADGDEAQPVVIATATLALQRQLIEHDIPRVIAGLAPLMRTEPSAAVLKGRHHYLCRLRLTEQPDPGAAAPELFTEPGGTGWLSSQFQQVRAWSEETTTGDRDDLPEPVDGRVWRSVSVTSRECVGRQRCPEGDECFAELARDRARAADVVVTNHAMLAIEWIDRKPVLPEHDAVIIDEAHEWVDRATSAATADLAPGAAEALV